MFTYSFLLTSLIVVIVPGTGVIYTISIGLTEGRQQSVWAAVGCTLGIVPHMAVGIGALALIDNIEPAVFDIIRYMGAAYLVWLGINMIRSGGAITLEERQRGRNGLEIGLKAILINLLNPKLTLFFLSFIPQYVMRDQGHLILQGTILGGVFMVMTLIVFLLYGFLAAVFYQATKKSAKGYIWIQRFFGLGFIGFALRLLVA